MKKLIFLAIALFLAISFTACKFDMQSEVLDNMSDIRYNLFEAKTEDLTANVMCGMRENPYEYDGVSCTKCEFGIITVTYNVRPEFEEIDFVLKIDNVDLVGVLEENPYDHTFMADIEKIIDSSAEIFLTIDGVEGELQFASVSSDWAVQYSDALTIALERLNDDLPQFFSNKQFLAECYLKIIFDLKSTTAPYFWYFGIVGQSGTTIALIIDTETGNILTRSI